MEAWEGRGRPHDYSSRFQVAQGAESGRSDLFTRSKAKVLLGTLFFFDCCRGQGGTAPGLGKEVFSLTAGLSHSQPVRVMSPTFKKMGTL